MIAELLTSAERVGLDLWLRGGWAMDFFLGEFTRPHGDVDWFAWAQDVDRLTELLLGLGYVSVDGPPPEQQRDFARDGEEHAFAFLATNSAGQVVVAGGPWAGEPWPDGMLDAEPGRLGEYAAPIIAARAQLEIKEMMPVWVPGRPRRAKDIADIAVLRAELAE